MDSVLSFWQNDEPMAVSNDNPLPVTIPNGLHILGTVDVNIVGTSGNVPVALQSVAGTLPVNVQNVPHVVVDNTINVQGPVTTSPTGNLSWLQNGAGSKLIKNGAGSLAAVAFNIIGIAANVAIYDGLNAGGTLLAQPTILLTTATPFSIAYNIKFNVGLFIVVTGLTANVTVTYT